MAESPRITDAHLLLAIVTNQTGHFISWERGRKTNTIVVLITALLSATSGVAGLADLVSKGVISTIAIVTAISTAGSLFALTKLQPEKHLQAYLDYSELRTRIVSYTEIPPRDRAEASDVLKNIWDEFNVTKDNVTRGGASLTKRQIEKYGREATTVLSKEQRQRLDAET